MTDTQSLFQFEATLVPALKPILYTKQKMKRDAIKSAGGAAYEALLKAERAQLAARRAKNGRASYDRISRKSIPFQTYLCANARARGRKRGFGGTIVPSDLIWPTHCPVLGLELDYPKRSGERGALHPQSNWPSLDRWDSTKGYVPGNVFVISYRANTLKSSATYEEILKVAKYLSRRP